MLHKHFILFTFLLISLLSNSQSYAKQNSCSRTVLINGENIAIDASSTQKGEGLRYYLDKDPIALNYFEEYVKSNQPNWRRIGVSTLGVGLIIAGAFSSNDTDNNFLKRDTLLYTGIGLAAFSFIYAKTKQGEKEIWLKKSIKEYNRRNKPRIFWAPQYRQEDSSWGFSLTKEY